MPSIKGFEIKNGQMTEESKKKLVAAGVDLNPFKLKSVNAPVIEEGEESKPAKKSKKK